MYTDNLTQKVAEAAQKVIDAENAALKKESEEKAQQKQDRLISESAEQIDEMDKSQPSSSRGAEGLATGSKGNQISRKKATTDMLKVLQQKMKASKSVKEQVEQIDELSKGTLGSYIKKASHDAAAKSAASRGFKRDADEARGTENYVGSRKSEEKSNKSFEKSWNRRKGIAKAVDRLTSNKVTVEEVESVDEAMEKPKNAAELRKMNSARQNAFYSKGAEKEKTSKVAKASPEQLQKQRELRSFGANKGHYGGHGSPVATVRGGGYLKAGRLGEESTEEEIVSKASFTEMLDSYKNGGLKEFFENFEAIEESVEEVSEEVISEEPTNDEFKAELEKTKKKAAGTEKAEVSKPREYPVVVQKEEVEQVDEASDIGKLGKKYAKAEKDEAEKQDTYSKKYPGGNKQKEADKAAFMKRFAK